MELAKENVNTNTLEKFSGVCVNVLNQHALCKKKNFPVPDSWVRTFLTQSWPGQDQATDCLKIEQRKIKDPKRGTETIVYFSQQKRKEKFTENVNEKDGTDNKTFWKTVEFFFHIKREIVDSVKNKIGKYKEHSSVIPIRLKSLKI